MKIVHFIVFALLFSASIASAQSQKNTFFNQHSLINKFHTIDELESLKKGELVKLYVERIKEIVIVMPYLSLTNEADVTLEDVGIKENSHNLKILDKHHKSTMESFNNTKGMITEFIPYADTDKIIWSILYFEEVIKKIRVGVNGNF